MINIRYGIKFLGVPLIFVVSLFAYRILFPIDYPPVKISYRTSLVLGSKEKVIRVCNTSTNKLCCKAIIGGNTEYKFTLMPNSYQEIGTAQIGRNFEVGEEGTVYVEGSFFPAKIKVRN